MPTGTDTQLFTTFRIELEAELVAAHRRLARRRRRQQLLVSAAAALVIAVLAGTLLAVLRSDPVAASMLRIDRQPDGSVQITVVGDDIDAEGIAAELAAAGIANTTRGSATGPSRVGTITAVGASTSDAPINHSARAATLPAGFSGRLELTVGVAARGSEPYEVITSPFDPGEPLAGFERRMDASAIVAAARAKALQVQIVDPGGREVESVSSGATVIAVAMTAADTVRVRLAT